MSNNRYMQRGVSAAKEDVHAAIKNIDKGLYPQAFCKIIPDILGGDPEYCNIMHADGAGTKSSLAYMYWRETGDLSVCKGIAQDALDPHFYLNRGYLSDAMNNNLFVLNGEVSFKFLKNRAELILAARDLLNKETDYSSVITATTHTESGQSFLHHYATLTFRYKLEAKKK